MGTLIRSNKRLAEILGVSPSTISVWRRLGYLNNAVAMEVGSIIVYDLDMVYHCLSPKQMARHNMKYK